MKEDSVRNQIQELLKSIGYTAAFVLYTPTKDEVDYTTTSFPLVIHPNQLIVPKDKNSNPFEWADKSLDKFKNSDVCILIPGKKFDICGTRHGRGGGWYDRFLSHVPPTWLRIGIVDQEHFSDIKLVRQKWDEPVHWIVIRDGLSWIVRKTEFGG